MAANNETPKWTVVKSYPTSIGLCGGLIYALAPIVIVVIGLTVYQADDTNEGLVALYICLVVAAVVGTLLLGASQLTTDICEEGIHTYWRFGYPYRHLEFSEISEVKESVYNCWHFGGFGCRVGVCDPEAKDAKFVKNWAWGMPAVGSAVVLWLTEHRKFTFSSSSAGDVVDAISGKLSAS